MENLVPVAMEIDRHVEHVGVLATDLVPENTAAEYYFAGSSEDISQVNDLLDDEQLARWQNLIILASPY